MTDPRITKERVECWAKQAPWKDPFAIEADLLQVIFLRRLLAEPEAQERVAIRGGLSLVRLLDERRYRASPDLDLVAMDDDTAALFAASERAAAGLFTAGRALRGYHGPLVERARRSCLDPNRFIKIGVHIVVREPMVGGFIPLTIEDEAGGFTIPSYSVDDAMAIKSKAFAARRKASDLIDCDVCLRNGRLTAERLREVFHFRLGEENKPLADFDTVYIRRRRLEDAAALAAEARAIAHPEEGERWTEAYAAARIDHLFSVLFGNDAG